MNKILLVSKREFLTRVQKKTFLLTTILLPLIIFGFYAMIIYFSVNTGKSLRIAVTDKANIFNGKIENKDNKDIQFSFLQNETAASLNEKLERKEYDGYIFIPDTTNVLRIDSVNIVTSEKAGLETKNKVATLINNQLHDSRLLALKISKEQLDSAQINSSVKFNTLKGDADSNGRDEASLLVGYISGFLIYIILFIYGTMVMRGVMEEKVSRIAEVIVSSVRPFQLMFGKIIGIGAVGLVQFIIWIVLVLGTRILLFILFPSLAHQMQASASAQGADSDSIVSGLQQINVFLTIGCFIFYFLGGYLLYSALFAAVGSAVNEDPQDAQSLMLPITMPIIFSIVIMTKAVNDPSSGIAVFGSLFPLTSPVVMMARIAHGVPDPVPYWELISSMLFLILGFLASTWLAAKIYRTGILLYGKKVTWKEMWKWAFRRG